MPQSTNQEFSPSVFPVGKRGALCAFRTNRFKTARLSLFTVLPQSRKNAVLAPLLLNVLRRGCEGYPNLLAIDRRTDELWGSSVLFRNFPFGDRLIVGLTLELIDPAYLPEKTALLPDLADLVHRLLFRPLTDANGLLQAATVEDEKRLQCDEIESLVASPRRYAAEHAATFFFEGRPCGVPPYGSVEETQAVTPRELTDFWRAFCKESFFTFYYVGASDPAAVATVLGGALPELSVGTAVEPSSFLDVLPPVRASRIRKKEESLPIGQGHLVLFFQAGGIVLGDDRLPAMELAKEILGGSPISFLFMNVREKLSLCYSVSAYYLSARGALTIRCALEPSNRKKAEREILLQVDRLKNGAFTESELDAARKSLIYYYRTIWDNPASMEHLLLRRRLAAAKATPDEMIARIKAVTREEIVQTANLLSLDTVYFLSAKGGQTDEV